MNRKKTKNEIKELKKALKAANRVRNVRLFKIALVVAILSIVAAFIYPNPVRSRLRHWTGKTFNISFSPSPHASRAARAMVGPTFSRYGLNYKIAPTVRRK